jgi:hypothetical protein
MAPNRTATARTLSMGASPRALADGLVEPLFLLDADGLHPGAGRDAVLAREGASMGRRRRATMMLHRNGPVTR